jgi:hypothetical protein
MRGSSSGGGEYEVVLLTHVKDDSIPLDDPLMRKRLLQQSIPREIIARMLMISFSKNSFPV